MEDAHDVETSSKRCSRPQGTQTHTEHPVEEVFKTWKCQCQQEKKAHLIPTIHRMQLSRAWHGDAMSPMPLFPIILLAYVNVSVYVYVYSYDTGPINIYN